MAARMRAENILIKSIKKVKQIHKAKRLMGPEHLEHGQVNFYNILNFKDNVGSTILKKLDESYDEQMYIFIFFLRQLPAIYDGSYQKENCIKALCKAVKEEAFHTNIGERLTSAYWSFPEDWRNTIISELPDLKVDDEIPF